MLIELNKKKHENFSFFPFPSHFSTSGEGDDDVGAEINKAKEAKARVGSGQIEGTAEEKKTQLNGKLIDHHFWSIDFPPRHCFKAMLAALMIVSLSSLWRERINETKKRIEKAEKSTSSTLMINFRDESVRESST